jgi:tRNA pseudouridine38-40 synthase
MRKGNRGLNGLETRQAGGSTPPSSGISSVRTSYKLTVEYDGTEFHGWQKQPGKRTVQEELERAVRKLDPGASKVTGAGRTDAGVHAAGQAASIRINWSHGPEKLGEALNSLLPADVAVTRAEERGAGFDARRDARERRYRYVILCRRPRSPLLDRYVCRVRYPVDFGAMRKAAALFRGRHDFSAFCLADARGKGPVREIANCQLKKRDGLILLDVSGRGFLHRMVRLMAGALLAVGSGKLEPDGIRKALAGGSTGHLGNAAPARGLTLLDVEYPGKRRENRPSKASAGHAIKPAHAS